MPVNVDFVLFPVNYASDYASGTTYMAWSLIRVIFAGVSAMLSFREVIYFVVLGKNTLVVLCVLSREYAK